MHHRNPYTTHFNRYLDPSLRKALNDTLGLRRHRPPNTSKTQNPFSPSPEPCPLSAEESDYLVYQIECYTAPPGPFVSRPHNRRRPVRFALALLWRREKRRCSAALAAARAFLVAVPIFLCCFASLAWAPLQALHLRLAPYVSTAWASTCGLRIALFGILLPRIGALYVLLWIVSALTGLPADRDAGRAPVYVLVPEFRMWSGPFAPS